MHSKRLCLFIISMLAQIASTQTTNQEEHCQDQPFCHRVAQTEIFCKTNAAKSCPCLCDKERTTVADEENQNRKIPSGVDQDKGCGENEWWCEERCIQVNQPCKEQCHYNPSYETNVESFNQINIPAYCKDKKECRRQLDICNLHSSEQEGCLISKDVCTNNQFKSRKCSNSTRSVECRGHWLGQCIPRSYWMDGKYDCLDRSDEPLEGELATFSSFEFHEYNLSECTTEDGHQGLLCEIKLWEQKTCVPFSEWCKPSSVGSITKSDSNTTTCTAINDPVLCGNITFWNSTIREKSNCEIPCSGTYPGQCTTDLNVCDGDTSIGNGNCKDKTDEICEKNINLKEDKDFEQMCNEHGYWYCKNQKQCIHQELKCDGIINCKDSSDENGTMCKTNDCSHDSSKSYSCPHLYTGAQICASRCNNIKECQDGLDEISCDDSLMIPSFVLIILFFSLYLISYTWTNLLAPMIQRKLLPHLHEMQSTEQLNSQKNVIQTFQNTSFTRTKNDPSQMKTRIIKIFQKSPFTRIAEQSNQKRPLFKVFQNDSFSKKTSSSVVELSMAHQLIHCIPSTILHSKNLSFVVQLIFNSFDKRKRNMLWKILYRRELSFHGEDKIETAHCLKQNIGTNSMCQCFLDAQEKQLLEKIPIVKYIVPKLIDFTSFIMKYRTTLEILTFTSIVFYYLDLVKDVILLILICLSIDMTSLTLDSFSTQLIITYTLSIGLPLILSWIALSFYHLEAVWGFNGQQRFPRRIKIILQIFSVFLIPFIPAILLRKEAMIRQQRTFLHTKMKKKTRKNRNADDLFKLNDELMIIDQQTEELHQLLATFRRCELLEIMFQTCITCILMCMNWYQLSLTSGELQGFFNESAHLLTIFLLLTGRKVLIVCLHVQQVSKKGFQTMFGKLLLGLHIMMAAIVRVCAVILYFAVPLGMFELLIHFKYETTNTPWRKEMVYSVFSKDTQEYETIFLSNITSELLSSIPVTHYIGIELGHYYICFLIGILLHIIGIVAMEEIKRIRQRKQRQNKETSETNAENIECQWNVNYESNTNQNVTSRELDSELTTLNDNTERKNLVYSVINASTTLISPVVSSDWDDVEFAEDVRSSNDFLKVYKENWSVFRNEYLFLILLTFIENLLLISPAFYLYSRVAPRHEFLERTIGPVDKEITTMNTLQIIVIVAPVILVCSIPLQICLMWLFQKYGHPWKIFFQNF